MFYEEALALQSETIEMRRYLHQHAEINYDLPQTIDYICRVLEKHEIPYTIPCKGTVVCELGNGPKGLILRADTDALPMQEENNLAFTSLTEYAHTCGHDLHTAMLLGAAILLKRHEDSLITQTRLIFQPDEEGATGAKFVIENHLLEGGYKGAIALHVSPVQESGVLYMQDGPLYASSDELDIYVHGANTHGAAPHNGHDPIFAGIQIYNALQGLISRECPPSAMAALSICTFHAGDAFNLVPDTAHLLGTFRTYQHSLRTHLKERMETVVTHSAAACDCSATLHFPISLPPVINDHALQEKLRDIFRNVLPARLVQPQPTPFSWSEDFGLFGEHLPISMMTLGAQVGQQTANIHNADVLFNENAMPTGVAALASAAYYFKP